MFNPYMQQPNIDRINAQINELEKIKAQIQQPQPSINQTFQLAPNREVIRYADTIDEVQRDMVVGETPYFSKDMSIVWIKNQKGDIRTFELKEIIPKDSKDIEIEYLKLQIEELKKGLTYGEHTRDDNETKDATNDDGSIRTTIKSTKPKSIPKLSTSEKE